MCVCELSYRYDETTVQYFKEYSILDRTVLR